MPYYSYVLRSFKNGLLYKGSTENIEKRLQHHNAGESNYTSKHTPWELVIAEAFETRVEAIKREKWYSINIHWLFFVIFLMFLYI